MGNTASRVPLKHFFDQSQVALLPRRKRRDASLVTTQKHPGQSVRPPTLRLSRNGEVIQEISLDVPHLLIGRTDDNDLSIPSRYVSRHHILLVRHRNSTVLVDLNSTNGTFVNSERVYDHVLANKDVISVDRHSMWVEFNITFIDRFEAARGKPGDAKSVDAIIKEALAEAAQLLGKSDTDLMPALSENVPTELGIIDDR